MARVEDMEQLLPDPGGQPRSELRKYFSAGEEKISHLDDYTSHNTERLDVEQVKTLLLKLQFIQEDLELSPPTAKKLRRERGQ